MAKSETTPSQVRSWLQGAADLYPRSRVDLYAIERRERGDKVGTWLLDSAANRLDAEAMAAEVLSLAATEREQTAIGRYKLVCEDEDGRERAVLSVSIGPPGRQVSEAEHLGESLLPPQANAANALLRQAMRQNEILLGVVVKTREADQRALTTAYAEIESLRENARLSFSRERELLSEAYQERSNAALTEAKVKAINKAVDRLDILIPAAITQLVGGRKKATVTVGPGKPETKSRSALASSTTVVDETLEGAIAGLREAFDELPEEKLLDVANSLGPKGAGAVMALVSVLAAREDEKEKGGK